MMIRLEGWQMSWELPKAAGLRVNPRTSDQKYTKNYRASLKRKVHINKNKWPRFVLGV